MAVIFSISVFASFWTEWTEYPANPVLDPASGARAYYPTVLYNPDRFNGHGTTACYKMWFASPDSGPGGIAFAYSDDGINWTEFNGSLPLTGLPSSANHPVVLYDPDGFGTGVFFYKIWYWDGSANLTTIGAVRYAESVDGITWQNDQPVQQHPSDPALQLVDGAYGSYFFHLYGPGCLLYNPAAADAGSGTPDDKSDDQPMTYRYIMFYDTSGEGSSPNGSVEQEALAYSTDGIYWIRYGDEPVLLPSGDPLDWDGVYAFRASVIRVDGTFHMWYGGSNGDDSIGTYYAHGIGHASSTDGLTWTKDPDNPVFHVTDGIGWRDVRTYTPCVIRDADGFSGHGDPDEWKMWFTGRTGGNYAIGYAGLSDEPPVAVFACRSEASIGESICFDGSASYDPDGDEIVEYSWRLVSRPDGSSAVLRPNTAARSCFIPDVSGIYRVALRVATQQSPGVLIWSDEEICRVTTRDHPPSAEFPCVRDGEVGREICYDGSTSYDPDGTDITEFSWSLLYKPSGSRAVLSSPDSVVCCLSPDVQGFYGIALRVRSDDGGGEPVWSERTICVTNVKGYAYCVCPEVVLHVDRMEDRMWHKTYRIEKLSWTLVHRYPGCEILKFRIFRMENGAWLRLSEVSASAREFEQRDVSAWHEYKVVPVLPDDRECLGNMDL